MTMTILAAALALTVGLLFAGRWRNRTSTPPSPTPPTTPTPTSATSETQMVTTMAQTFTAALAEMRGMVVDMTQGRVGQPVTSMQETPQMSNESSLTFDYDSTPLAPGIEAVLAREDNENEQARLLRERAALQSHLLDVQEEMDRLGLEDSSRTPWERSAPESQISPSTP